MSEFIHLSAQPNFPSEDLTDSNAEVLSHILSDESGLEVHARSLETHQCGIYHVAQRALSDAGIRLRYDEDELAAFSKGFTTFETISALVQPPRAYDVVTASRRALHLLVMPDLPEAAVDIEVATRFETWQKTQPNTDEVITRLGIVKGESARQITARKAGAMIAYELGGGSEKAA